MRYSLKGKTWLILYGIVLLNMIVFNLILWLLKPIWFDINNFLEYTLGIPYNWALVIFLVTILIIVYLCFQIYYGTKKIKTNKFKPNIINIIITVFIFIVWNSMLMLLISEMGYEIVLLKYMFLESLDEFIKVGLLVLVIIILPTFKSWNNIKLRFGLLGLILILIGIYIYNPGPPKIIVGPYLQAPTESSMTIMWITDEPCVSWVEYGEKGNLNSISYSQTNGLHDVNTVHKVKIDGLTPGTEYQYRINSTKVNDIYPTSASFGKSISGDIHSFKTFDLDNDEVKFLVINDIHEKVSLLEDFMIKETISDYDFIVFNGDTFNNILGERQLIDSLLKPVSNLFANEIPFIFVRGNHETRGKFARELDKYIDTPNSEYYYSFSNGPAQFIVIDTGEDKDDSHIEYSGLVDFKSYREDQYNWLQDTLEEEKNRNADFRIAFSHIPLNEYYMVNEPEQFMDYQRQWSKLLSENELDLLFSGHYHTNKIYEPEEGLTYPVVLGGGGAYSEGESYLFVSVKIDNKKVEIEYKDKNLNVVDSYILIR